MLGKTIGLALAALIATAATAQARVTVIYPPQSYQAQFKFCPLFWDELYSHDCYYLQGRYRHGFDRDEVREAASVNVTNVNVQVNRSRRAKTTVIVAPGGY